MTKNKFQFRPYRRRFKPPLQTNHGIWDVREGIILRLSDEIGRVGYGEIAPISWFGSETIEQALDFCRQLAHEITQETIFSISDRLPACQFGFESAWEDLKAEEAEEAGTGGYQGVGREKPLATHHSPLTTRHSPLTTHHSPLATRHSPLTTHHSLLATRHSPLATHHSPLAGERI